MVAAPRGRGLSRPAPKRAREGTRLRISQGCGDLAERHLRVGQKIAGDLVADLVRDLPECDTFRLQVTVQGAEVHREEAGARRDGAGILEQFGSKHPAHAFDEGAKPRLLLRLVRSAGERSLQRSLPCLPSATSAAV